MLISNATTRAFENVAARERDVLLAYSPGAIPERGDVAQTAEAAFALDPLSTAAPADAYFITTGDRGRQVFTHDGSFAVRDGTLVDAQGSPLLGFREDGSALAPLRFDAVDAALGLTSSTRIEADGSVTYDRTTIDPRTGVREVRRATLGRLALARFTAGTRLQTVDAQHVAAPPNIAPHIGSPGDGSFGLLQPFAREGSGVNIDLGLQRLQEAYLALDAIRAASKAQGGVEKAAMDLLK
jgi:flagellar basal body rod protein FlgG